MDVHVLGSVMDGSFLSKEEVRHWPIVGALATMAGTLYIRRGGKDASNAASELLTWNLIRGTNVLVFPEGTTSEGHGVRRFHPRLFAAALLADRPVQPVAIRYRDGDGDEPHPIAAFVGNQGLLDNLWGVIGERRFEVSVTFCPPVTVKGADRRSVANAAHGRIARVLEAPSAVSQGLPGS
jgi:1-acyl-sn-glycerol-3-phosphate acyltransferase